MTKKIDQEPQIYDLAQATLDFLDGKDPQIPPQETYRRAVDELVRQAAFDLPKVVDPSKEDS